MRLNLDVNGVDVQSVRYEISGSDFSTISGSLPVVTGRNPPVWALITGIPAGTNRTITLRAYDSLGNVICEGSATTDVLENQTTKVTVNLDCGTTPDEPRGDVEIDGDFNVISQNLCPLINTTSVIPEQIASGGTADVEAVASDPNGDALTFSWTATSGSFSAPTANATQYTCGADGTQTLTVVISDGDPSCDLSVSLEVTCGTAAPQCTSAADCDDANACTTDTCDSGVCNNTAIQCPDDTNECTAPTCNAVSGCGFMQVANGTSCDGGQGTCQSGTCTPNPACLTNSDCDDTNVCTNDACTNGVCVNTAVTCQDDGNECTAASCNPATGCSTTGVPAGTACNGGAGMCDGSGTCVANPVCGDGVHDTGEQCDDGNTTSGDGCSGTCQVEPGYECSGEPSVCGPRCGDGLVLSPETCDDFNTVAGDGCSSTCQVEPGYECSGAPSTCHAVCGDGIVAGNEQCDGGPGCRPNCTLEVCGDGIIDSGEACDDGNTANGDGCSSTCQQEPGYVNPGACFTDTIPLFPVGDDCRSRTLHLGHTTTLKLQVTNPLGGTLLARGKIKQGGSTIEQTGTVPVAGSGSTPTTVLPAGDYTIEVCDETGAGTGSFTACIEPEPVIGLDACYEGTVTDGDGNDVNLAGPLSGGDEAIHFVAPHDGSFNISLTNTGGGAIEAAGVYDSGAFEGVPGTLVPGSDTGIVAIGQTKTGGPVAVTAGDVLHIYVDVASAGAIGNYKVCTHDLPTGACLNDPNDATIAGNTDLEASLKACATGSGRFCGLIPNSGCVSSCLQANPGLSSECADCYGGVTACTVANCISACGADSNSPGCISCVNTNCGPAFAACSGWPTPAGPATP
ncbi:MAG: DUF4215 domain-containing protein [Myxococcales bacterium]|nr:DUF4215 domain-containing protein [Myxococcales bacterium]